jgi:hypothetical protein
MKLDETLSNLLADHPVLASVAVGAVIGFGYALDKALRAGRALNWQLIRELSASAAVALVLTGAAVELWNLGPMVASALCLLINMCGAVAIDRWTAAAEDRVERGLKGEDHVDL